MNERETTLTENRERAAAIAALLPDGWELKPVDPEDYRRVRLAGPDGCEIYFVFDGYRNKNRLEVHACWPNRDYRRRCRIYGPRDIMTAAERENFKGEITCALDRDDAKIAADIARRLLPAVYEWTPKMRKAIYDAETADAKAAATATAIAAACDDNHVAAGRNGNPDTKFYGYFGKPYDGEHIGRMHIEGEVYPGREDDVNFKIGGNLPAAELIRLIRLVNEVTRAAVTKPATETNLRLFADDEELPLFAAIA